MPYSKLSDAPANIRELNGMALTLAQVNWIANVADGLDPDEVESVWAVAIGQFKRSFVVRGGKWAKRKAEGRKDMEDRMGLLDRVMEFVGFGSVELEAKDQNFKTEGGVKFKRSDYAVRGESDKPTTWKLRLAEGSSGNFTVAQVARAITAMQPGGFRGRKVQLEPGEKEEAARNIGAAIGKVGDADQKENLRERLAKVGSKEFVGGIKVVEGKDGEAYWITRTSNAFEDKVEELFTTKALESYVEQVDEGIPVHVKAFLEKRGLPATDQGELWFWHIPGSRIGEPKWKGVAGRFLVEVGTFDDTPLGRAAKEHFKEHGDDYRVSHTFLHLPVDKKEGIYHWLWKFETSPVPAGPEANPWTGIDVIAREAKEMKEEKKAELVKIFGQELADGILAKAEEDSKTLEELGIRFKEAETDPEEEKPYVLEKDSKAMELLVAGVLEKAGLADVGTKLEELAAAVKAADERIGKIEEADKPQVVLNRGFRASQSAETTVETKDLPTGALPEGVHPLDAKLKRRQA